MKQPFEVPFAEVEANPEPFVDAVFSTLVSEFLVMPKGDGFVDYPTFNTGYERLKQATGDFQQIDAEHVLPAVLESPIALVVVRSILGFTPPEWAYVTSQRLGIDITQGAARSIDRRARLQPDTKLRTKGTTFERIRAMVEIACQLMNEGAPSTDSDKLHRLDKADTKLGAPTIRNMATMGASYSMVLYERFLGRPFAGHRDSVSELVGDPLESGIERVLDDAGITFRKTKRAEKVPGFPQAPDFIIPDENDPKVVIEAKFTEDDGTARDKVSRVLELVKFSKENQPGGQQKYEVIACIGGRGFGVRRSDMRKLIAETKGKVFTLRTLSFLVNYTTLADFRTRPTLSQ
jgi:hypothetical protein